MNEKPTCTLYGGRDAWFWNVLFALALRRVTENRFVKCPLHDSHSQSHKSSIYKPITLRAFLSQGFWLCYVHFWYRFCLFVCFVFVLFFVFVCFVFLLLFFFFVVFFFFFFVVVVVFCFVFFCYFFFVLFCLFVFCCSFFVFFCCCFFSS